MLDFNCDSYERKIHHFCNRCKYFWGPGFPRLCALLTCNQSSDVENVQNLWNPKCLKSIQCVDFVNMSNVTCLATKTTTPQNSHFMNICSCFRETVSFLKIRTESDSVEYQEWKLRFTLITYFVVQTTLRLNSITVENCKIYKRIIYRYS